MNYYVETGFYTDDATIYYCSYDVDTIQKKIKSRIKEFFIIKDKL